MEIKKKIVTFGEISKKYLIGFKALKNKVESYEVTFRPACTLADYKFTHTIYVNVIHLRRLNCTYIALTDVGFFDVFGPTESSETLVLRAEGIIRYKDIPKDIMEAALSEVYAAREKKIKEAGKEEP